MIFMDEDKFLEPETELQNKEKGPSLVLKRKPNHPKSQE